MAINFICCSCAEMLRDAYDTRLKLNDLHDTVRRRNMPFVPSLYRLLGMTLEDGVQNFADIILEAKNEFEEYNSPVVVAIIENVEGNKYYFKDNFLDWVNDVCPPGEVVFKPRSIINMTNVMTPYPSIRNSAQWRYEYTTGEFYCVWSNCRLKYYIDYPMVCKLLQDKSGFTDDSAIYLVADKDQFYDLCAFHILSRVKEYGGLIQLSGFSSQLQLDQAISRLEKKVEENRSRTSKMYEKWLN
jgi:hypothetical protein